MTEKIYILHKNGANSHYQALNFLLKKNNKELIFREFSVFGKLIKSIFKLDFKDFSKQIINFLFLLNLIFTKNKKVILGIAPFDKKIIILLFLLKRHKVYYHTSWANWDGTFVPKSKKVTSNLKRKWRIFLEEKCIYIFTVTERSKQQICKHYKVTASKIFVVKHSFDNSEFEFLRYKIKKNYSFVYVGRLRAEKGIEDLLNWFAKNNGANLTIVGRGVLENKVKNYACAYENISYLGYVNNKQKIVSIFNSHNYMILNSYKTKKWEELFGMVLIEGMACGLIPIASNHVGPKSIINKQFGYLYPEGNIEEILNSLVLQNIDFKMKEEAQKASEEYAIEKISKTWVAILL